MATARNIYKAVRWYKLIKKQCTKFYKFLYVGPAVEPGVFNLALVSKPPDFRTEPRTIH
jgi:hypothetical protein